MPNVEISTNTLDAQIRYTTNGSDVTEESSLYSAPFEVEAGTTIKAKAFKTGMNPSVQSTLQSLAKLQTPTVSLSRSGSTITVTIGNTVSGATYRYKVGSAPMSVTDGTAISSTATITSNDATTVYVAGWYYGQYNPSDAASDSVEEVTPVTLFMSLPDGSKPVYDRGSQYGEYCIGSDGYPMRLTSGDDWRYIICEEYDLNHYETDLGIGGVDSSYTGRIWGFLGTSTGVTDTAIGTGKNNTDQLINQNNNNSDYLWYYVNQHRTNTGKDWCVPSKDELNILYENLTQIGNFSTSTNPWYWSSSESSSNNAWFQLFSSGDQNPTAKNNTNRRVRCIRYV